MERVIIAHSPLSDDTLIFNSLKGKEKLSTIYSFEVELFSKNKDVDIKELRNKPISIEIKNPANIAEKSRFLSGIVREAIICDYYDEYYYLYKVIIQPTLFILTLNKDFRIWQKKTVPEIIKEVLNKHKVKFKSELNSKYQPLEYCTQYKETDFDFLSRLMEREGIYYYFQHNKNDHTLILADSPQSHSKLPEYSSIEYYPNHPPPKDNDKHYLYDWTVSYSITPKLYTMNDYNFLKPNALLKETQQNPDPSVPKTELFEWPGNYTENAQGQFYVRILQQSCTAQSQYIKAKSIESDIAPGYIFTLSKALRDKDNDDYLIVSADYELHESPYIVGVNSPSAGSSCKITTEFTAIPAKVNWRAPRITPWPIAGTDRATVVGANGKTIWTDKHGRVKLKFHWDRSDTKDDKSSCWVRVSNDWAGAKFGAIQIPRVGEEVIVNFINNNPDEPLVVGRSFNQNNMPPWELPKEATKMGIMTRSLEGGKDNASYLFIDDAQGKESFEIHAEKDMKVSVENDKTVSIDGSRITEIKKKQQDTVEQDATFHYKAKHETTVEQEENATYKNKQKTTVSNGKEVEVTSGGIQYTISGGYKASITGSKSENIRGSYKLDVTGNKNESVTGSADIKASKLSLESNSILDIKSTIRIAITAGLIQLG
ncbi:type VI secretion system Vgr family protein [Xenorhabdus anantnagensis]|uniref:Type VI secretion system tip protein TssI/VgrG n=1 Tax=Xenorhabdus anantnagensis TaxID=3025875 RepID=A0ABT5LNM4_9GAMM|nr:type VI secretion system tip protein TssI/VgrG [Xenorhabdus anantnagensis]MDC9595418.1 type VI secretion system tip protein TssI/VgrG [Xenorhabdus anantnagensis]